MQYVYTIGSQSTLDPGPYRLECSPGTWVISESYLDVILADMAIVMCGLASSFVSYILELLPSYEDAEKERLFLQGPPNARPSIGEAPPSFEDAMQSRAYVENPQHSEIPDTS